MNQMKEAELTARVLHKAKLKGLLTHHCKDGRYCLGHPGLPDVIILGTRGMLVRELKSEDGTTSADQDAWIYALYQSGVDVAVWRPSDLDDGTIDAEMDAIK